MSYKCVIALHVEGILAMIKDQINQLAERFDTDPSMLAAVITNCPQFWPINQQRDYAIWEAKRWAEELTAIENDNDYFS